MQGPVVTGRVWSFDDITERVAAERELRASEERFRIAAETANDVVYEWDLKQRVQWWGKIDELLGYEPDEFPRTLDGWASAVHPEDLERTMAQVQAHLERGIPTTPSIVFGARMGSTAGGRRGARPPGRRTECPSA